MNNLLGFIFLIAMYFGLREASNCWDQKVEIQNRLGPGRILKVGCSDSPNTTHWLKFNENYLLSSGQRRPNIFAKKKRRQNIWVCHIVHWPTKQPYAYDFMAELGSRLPPCIHGFRSWIAKVDGIYYEHNKIKPAEN
ncbi:unnamed protein product [Arabidopsis halleri]